MLKGYPKLYYKRVKHDAFAVMPQASGRGIGSKALHTDRVYPAISNIDQNSRP